MQQQRPTKAHASHDVRNFTHLQYFHYVGILPEACQLVWCPAQTDAWVGVCVCVCEKAAGYMVFGLMRDPLFSCQVLLYYCSDEAHITYVRCSDHLKDLFRTPVILIHRACSKDVKREVEGQDPGNLRDPHQHTSQHSNYYVQACRPPDSPELRWGGLPPPIP